MWIRSQDKETLVKTNRIDVVVNAIMCCCEGDDRIFIGQYSTEEKALKVLDMIERYIINEIDIKRSFNSYSMEYNGNYYVRREVFQMPKDDEVKVNDN